MHVVDMFNGVDVVDGVDRVGMLEGACVSPFSKEFL